MANFKNPTSGRFTQDDYLLLANEYMRQAELFEAEGELLEAQHAAHEAVILLGPDYAARPLALLNKVLLLSISSPYFDNNRWIEFLVPV